MTPVNITSRIIMAQNAQMMPMIAYGIQEIPSHPTQAMRNGGATCMNGMSAIVQKYAQKLEELHAMARRGFQIPSCCRKTNAQTELTMTATAL